LGGRGRTGVGREEEGLVVGGRGRDWCWEGGGGTGVRREGEGLVVGGRGRVGGQGGEGLMLGGRDGGLPYWQMEPLILQNWLAGFIAKLLG
jgi:hypothetical protein